MGISAFSFFFPRAVTTNTKYKLARTHALYLRAGSDLCLFRSERMRQVFALLRKFLRCTK